MKTAIPLQVEALAAFCRRWSIRRLEIFGSVLRSDFTSRSDVDFLATFDPSTKRSLYDLIGAEQELSGIVGRRVDLVDRDGLMESPNWLRRRIILANAQLVYAA